MVFEKKETLKENKPKSKLELDIEKKATDAVVNKVSMGLYEVIKKIFIECISVALQGA